MDSKLYTVKVQSNREKSLSERLKSEMNRYQVKGDIFVPVERVFFAKNGKKSFKEKIIYPGYIFVETEALSSLEYVLKSVPGNSGILRSKSGDPSLMKDQEIKWIKIKSDKDVEDEVVDLYHYVVGEEVQIIGGPFDKFVGKIEEIDNSRNKVKLNVLIFGRSTPVDLQLEQIQKVV